MAGVLPLLNHADEDWVHLVGQYILNMGAIEATTRLLIAIHAATDRAPQMTDDLQARIGFLRNRFPLVPRERHSQAMTVFAVAKRHAGFRNIVAHSPLVITDHQDGSRRIRGILNVTPNDEKQAGELVSLDELRGRVDESAELCKRLLLMQDDFTRPSDT